MKIDPEDYMPEEWLGFATSREAWATMQLLTEQGHMAGFPSLKPEANGLYGVRVCRLKEHAK